MRRTSRTVRVYRGLLSLLLPAGFSDAFASELAATFAQLDTDLRTSRGPISAWRGLAAEVPGLLRIAVRERRTARTIRAHQVMPRLEDNVFDSFVQDLSFAFRSLRRSPGFSVVAILTLALGIGANTAIFSVVNSVLLTPLRLREPERLMAIGEQPITASPDAINSTSPASFYDWKSSSSTMRIGGYSGATRVLTGVGEPQQLGGTAVIGGLMEILGVSPMLGRQLTAADEDPSAPAVVVLSFDAWHRLFGEDRGVIGKSLTLNGTRTTIVGVMPAGFSFPGAPNDFWMPSQLDAAFRANRDQYYLAAIGRLAPNKTLVQARAEMSGVSARLARDWPRYNQGTRIAVKPLRETIVGGVRRQLFVLMGAVIFVLLITCANIGNLLLARAAARRREIAVRRALGAGSARIARQLLTESLLLAALGGAAGMLVGRQFLHLLLAAQVTTNLPRADEISLDVRVLAFTLGSSALAGLILGCIPAWQLARSRSSDALREGARGSAGPQWTRSALVVAELALAMVLLTGAGLLLRSFALMARVNPGVNVDRVATFSIQRRTKDGVFFADALERIRAIPGVRAAAITSSLPISGRGIGAWFNRIDRPLPDNVQPTGEAYRVVSPGYFATVGIPLKAGRVLGANDRRDAPAIVVNEALVRKYYPNESPLGKPVYLGAPDNRLFNSAPIVGVVGDTRDIGLANDPLPTVYIPSAMMPSWPFFAFVIRTAGDPTRALASARQIIHDLDPSLPIRSPQRMEEVLSAAIAPARWSTTLLGVFAGVALVIAVLGVFGVLSFVVTQRTRELGIRIALGASSGAVRRAVMGRGLALVGAGVLIGTTVSWALTRFMSTLLFGVTPTDPATFIGVSAVLVAAATAASYLPARRATRVDPIIALRAE